MKPVLQTDKNITSTLDGQRITMEFDANSLAHLQNLYINLYQDREMAVLREYSCNAYDAHVEAGLSDPIEIMMPTRFEPVLKITDHGVGLSKQDLEETYSKYGASTKRDSNDVIGSFGLGCKSALTYTDQFTVRARKDGREVIVSVSRNAEGIGELTVAHEADTEEANGVEITIPTPGQTTFAEKAAKLFQYWPEGSVLVDGVEPQRFKGTPLLPDIYLESSEANYYDNERSVVVMGNVPYPVEHSDFGLDFSDNAYHERRYHRIVAYVPIGTVEPIPAREGLTTTSANEKALKEIGTQIKENIADLIQTEVDKADSMLASIRVIFEIMRSYPRIFHPKVWTYKGEKIPLHVKALVDIEDVTDAAELTAIRAKSGYVPDDRRKRVGGFVTVRRNDSGKHHNRVKDLGWEQITNCIYLQGFDLDRFTPSHRRRLDEWLGNNYSDQVAWHAPLYVLTETLPDSELIDQTKIYDWEDVRNTKLPSNRTAGGGLTGAYDTVHLGTRADQTTYWETLQTQAASIDKSKPIFFYCELETRRTDRRGYSQEKSRAEYAQPYVTLLLSEYPDAQFFCLPPNRRPKFERNFPTAVEMRAAVKAQAEQWAKSLTRRQRKQLAVHRQGYSHTYATLLPVKDRLKDPDLREHIQLMSVDPTPLTDAIGRYQRYVVNLDEDVLKLEPVENIMDRYPLVRDLGHYGIKDHVKDHVTLYLNSAYKTFHTTT